MTIGSRVSRDLEVPGRELKNIHFAMDYLYQRNRWVAQQEGRPTKAPAPGTEISAAGKRVIVVGGGDTGMDCISNSNREGAESVYMLDVYQALTRAGRILDTRGRCRRSGRRRRTRSRRAASAAGRPR